MFYIEAYVARDECCEHVQKRNIALQVKIEHIFYKRAENCTYSSILMPLMHIKMKQNVVLEHFCLGKLLFIHFNVEKQNET